MANDKDVKKNPTGANAYSDGIDGDKAKLKDSAVKEETSVSEFLGLEQARKELDGYYEIAKSDPIYRQILGMVGKEIVSGCPIADGLISDQLYVEAEDGTIIPIREDVKLKKKIGISLDKLAKWINHECVCGRVNHYRLIMNVEAFAKQCGEKTDKESLKHFIKKLKDDILILTVAFFTINTEKIQDMKVHIIAGDGRIRSKCGLITLTLNPDYVDYLSQNERYCYTWYSAAAMKINGHYTSDYIVANLLNQHYCMRKNQENGTADIIKAGTVRSWARLPSNEELIESGRAYEWEERQKEAMEAILDRLTIKWGVLAGWEYCGAKGILLEEEEPKAGESCFISSPYTFNGPNPWSEARIHFTLVAGKPLSIAVTRKKAAHTAGKKRNSSKSYKKQENACTPVSRETSEEEMKAILAAKPTE